MCVSIRFHFYVTGVMYYSSIRRSPLIKFATENRDVVIAESTHKDSVVFVITFLRTNKERRSKFVFQVPLLIPS
jgi:hypothetical protein